MSTLERSFADARLRAVLVVLALVLVAAGVAAAVAGGQYRKSFDASLSLDERLTAARTARVLAPWDEAVRIRERIMAGWVSGRNLLESGNYPAALKTLNAAASLQRPADPGLVALYKQASRIEALDTIRKAHTQHGREGPGSTLRPQDVER